MAVDILRHRQMAYKIVRLPQRRSKETWREVNLLKGISHVREQNP